MLTIYKDNYVDNDMVAVDDNDMKTIMMIFIVIVTFTSF